MGGSVEMFDFMHYAYDITSNEMSKITKFF